MADLPGGTVTFLFTDIEGSTARWEQHPEAMRIALARHDALLRQAVVAHDGHVVKTTGDGLHAAFARAPDALAAALAAQRALIAEAWELPRPLRARMGLHSGVADERDGDYYGAAVNRAARLMQAGHGGQVLLSEATYELVRDAPPDGTMLVDLGEHRLKDLIRPDRVYQLSAPDLPAEFPPLRTLDIRPNNLPLQTTPLLGREREVVAARDRLLRDDVRLLTLTGPGGTGKTRLSLQVAAEVVDQLADGVFFIALAPISDPNLVPATIAQELEIRDVGGRPVLDSLKDYLRGRQILLVLDNFEQILSAAPVVADLLEVSSGLKVLVTSRAPLQLRAEHELAVPPLALPDPQRLPALDALAQYGSVALFIERAAAIRPDFAVTDENAPAVAEICVRLDGLPLAIELAAARIRLLNPRAMLARLERRLSLLTGGARDLPARQQTLRGTIAWSYDLLDEAERTLFRRLSIFVGGFTLAAGSWVAGDGPTGGPAASAVTHNPAPEILDALASLVANSLLRQEEGPDGELRFGMLETIREFASELLDASGEAQALRDRHLDFYLAFAMTANVRLRGPDQLVWFDCLERENDNLRAALERSAADGDPGAARRVDKGISLASAVAYFWVLRGRARENLPRVMALLGLAPPGTPAQARALAMVGQMQGHMLGDYEGARPFADEGLRLWRTLGDPMGIAFAALSRGQIASQTGDHLLAMELFAESRAHLRELPATASPVPLPLWMAEVAQAQGDYDYARQLLDEGMAEAQARGDNHGMAFALRELARLHRAEGRAAEAIPLLGRSLTILGPLKDVRCAQICLEDLAGVLSERGDAVDVARLLGASEALGAMIGKPLTQVQRAAHDRDVATVQARLDPERFTAAWTEGRSMTLDQAIACASEQFMRA